MENTMTENELDTKSEAKADASPQLTQLLTDKFGGEVLRLTLKKKPFEVMMSGEKDEEYRKATDWILSRLKNKDGSDRAYDYVEFVNGYGKDRPRFFAEYKGWMEKVGGDVSYKYSNGLKVEVLAGDLIIFLGKVVAKFNC